MSVPFCGPASGEGRAVAGNRERGRHCGDECPLCGPASGEGRAVAGNRARVRHCEDECPLCRPGDGERDARGGTGLTIVPLTAPATAKGTIVWKTTNACGVVG